MRRKFIYTIGILAAIVFATSCQYKFIVEPVVPPPDPGDTVYYSQEIEPIYSTQGCTGCHNTGGTQPDLSAGNSYNSITSMGLVDVGDPVASKIYYYPLPDGSHFAKYTSVQAALILGWIEQGANDN
ncbi:MAG: hypothetical protein KQH67_08935 [Bacteroidetes bacterium]|nr:hypothetical protein [Bacteroidota bacterium]